ncbi:hypothetical protein L484_011045 [Morus notabilis]|uniref:Uncharacterized protein n=1 Tax=Morus notabilis TaxID=981085 RepID=W9R1Z6_9ROSA|nr:hypothetical protein L484_011045 [Morus notabilis]
MAQYQSSLPNKAYRNTLPMTPTQQWQCVKQQIQIKKPPVFNSSETLNLYSFPVVAAALYVRRNAAK